MAVDQPLTIREYLDPRRVVAGGRRRAGNPGQGAGSFRGHLVQESSQKAAAPASGLSLADYFARPVRSAQASRLPGAGGKKGMAAEIAAQAPIEPSGGRLQPRVDRSEAMDVRPKPAEAARGASTDSRRQSVPEASPRGAVERAIRQAAATHNLSPDLIRSVIRAESGFRADAVSPAGAQGLMQLMPETAAELGVSNPFDIRQNIDGGARYLRRMLDRFDGDLRLALSAYNAGPGAVEKYEGQVPYAETRAYVQRVLRFAGISA